MMILVIGSVTVSEDSLAQAISLSQQHVNRSRSEHGCVSHELQQDTENPCRLVFVERWKDMDALEQHFQVPESGEFVAAIGELATASPEMNLYECQEIRRH